METLLEIIDINSLMKLLESIVGLVNSLVNFSAVIFSWLGTEIISMIAAGAIAALILRFLGR